MDIYADPQIFHNKKLSIPKIFLGKNKSTPEIYNYGTRFTKSFAKLKYIYTFAM